MRGWVWCVKYGEMNGSILHAQVESDRANYSHQDVLLFKGRRQSRAKGENTQQVETAVQYPRGPAAHSLARGSSYQQTFFFFLSFFLRKNYSTVSLSLVRFNNFHYFIFLCNCTSAQINFISLKAIPPTSSPLPSPLFHCSCSFFSLSTVNEHMPAEEKAQASAKKYKVIGIQMISFFFLFSTSS